MPNFTFFKGLDDAQISQKHDLYSHSLKLEFLTVLSADSQQIPWVKQGSNLPRPRDLLIFRIKIVSAKYNENK